MNKMKKLFALILAVLVLCCVFTACKPGNTDNTQPSATATQKPSEATTEAVTTQGEEITIKLLSTYAPVNAFDADGNEVGISLVYGSSYRDYGGSLCFKEDGTFTTFIGVFGNVDNESGTYKIISDTQIELLYNNDTTEIATVLKVDSDLNVTELIMPHRSYDVVFSQE